MLQSDDRHIAFIHVPKTGGWSVYKALRQYKPASDWHDGTRWVTSPMFFVHMTAAEAAGFMPDWRYFFSFAVVRNPWDRVVSAWAHWTGHTMTLENFIDREYGPHHYWMPQTEYLLDRDGSQLVRSIVQYESLDADLTGLLRLREPLSRLNASVHRPYQEYYSPPLVQQVADKFAVDIERFGYTFDAAKS